MLKQLHNEVNYTYIYFQLKQMGERYGAAKLSNESDFQPESIRRIFQKMITIRKFNPEFSDDQVIQTAIKEHRKTLLQRTVNDIENNPELARKLGILKEVI
ncbi:hypothetical protein DH09_00580 (plasmid) [Bacillaceae bacterium JMAK1]|nr:hypothetical protein DH09_00580 [Bacillaceae bacterium JMAK1]